MRELYAMVGKSADPGAAETDRKLYTEAGNKNYDSYEFLIIFLLNYRLGSPLCDYASVLPPGGNGWDPLCVKSPPAQNLLSSALQSPAPAAS